MTFAELTVKFKTEGASTVKKDTADLSNVMNDLAGKMGLATTGASLAADAIIAAGKAIFDAGKFAVKSAIDFDTNIRALANYSKNAQELSAQMTRLEEIAKLPGLGLPEVMKGVSNLEAAGFSAKLAEASIKQFGNALALAGKGKSDLDGIALALQQIKSKGQISAEEINQLAERAPQIRQAMKSAFGTSNTEELQKMGIGATEFVSKITDELAKLPRAQGGLNTLIENAQDALTKAAGTVGAGFVKLFTAGGGESSKFFDMIQNSAEQINIVLTALSESEAFKAIQTNIKVIIDSLAKMGPFFKGVFTVVLGLIVGVVQEVTQRIAFVANFLGQLFSNPLKTIKNEFVVLGQQIKAILNNALAGALDGLRKFVSGIDKFAGTNFASKIPQMATLDVPGQTAGQKALGALLSGAPGFEALKKAAAATGQIMGLEKPFQKLPSDLMFGGGGGGGDTDTKTGKDTKEKEAKKAREKQQKTLDLIESHTKQTSEATLRNMTYGGGMLAAQGISNVEMRGYNRVSSPQISASNDIVRGVEKLYKGFQVSNSLNINPRRA